MNVGKKKTEFHKEILRCIGVKERDLDETAYQLENGKWITSCYSSENRPHQWFFSLKGTTLGNLRAGAFVLLICGSLRQILVVPAIELIRWLITPDIPTRSDGSWRFKIYKDNDIYEMSIPVTGERKDVSEHLNNFVVLGKNLRQMEKVIERDISDDYTDIGGGDWEEATRKIQEYIPEYQEIVSSLKEKYKNKCQVEGCGYTFRKRGGGFYSEGHHLIWRAEGGGPEASNVVILCPNHHRTFHYADVEIRGLEGHKRRVTINGVHHLIVY
ncbi:hypothetical protein LCGC14_0876850 [marine sediment metagenome]|uniref:HNH nuclease domain-containing protein n=1 Tax=marine sediment metagenome TaxID=412755 RepID=A0A0F9PNN4_9ZZZZ